MKKFFALILAIVVLFGAFITYKNWDARESVIASQTEAAAQTESAAQSEELSAQSEENTAADAAGEEQSETASYSVELDYDKLYALHDPEEVVMQIDGKDITWGDYFYWLYYQSYRITNTLTQMSMYYGMTSTWDDPIDAEGTETISDIAVSNSLEMLKQQLAIDGLAEETGAALTAEEEAEMAEDLEAIYTQAVGEDATEEEKDDFVASMYLTREKFEAINTTKELYEHIFNEKYGENGEKYSDELAKKYLEDNEYIAANHILFMTIDPTIREALDDETIAEKKALAEKTLAELNAIEDEDERIAAFARLKEELDEDTGKEAHPDGYLFTPGTMVTEFEDAAKALDEYAISDIVESSYGYHIIMRLPLDPDMPIEKDTDGNDVTARMLSADAEYDADIQERMDAMNVEYVNGYEPPKLGEFVKQDEE